MQLDELTADHFEPYLEQLFTFQVDADATLETRLVSVTQLGEESANGQTSDHRRAFSLIFLGPMTPILRQGMYIIENAALGALEIFVVPVGPDSIKQGMSYEAIFT